VGPVLTRLPTLKMKRALKMKELSSKVFIEDITNLLDNV
jgi:hypothetical protein